MKKAHGFLMLLLLALLVSLPVAADGLAPSKDHALVITAPETKIVVEEEVAGYSGEKVAVQSVAPIPAATWFGYNTLVVSKVEAAHSDFSAVRQKPMGTGGGRPCAGFT